MWQYIRNTFNAAKDGMSINGMDSREMEAEVAKAQEGEGQTVDVVEFRGVCRLMEVRHRNRAL